RSPPWQIRVNAVLPQWTRPNRKRLPARAAALPTQREPLTNSPRTKHASPDAKAAKPSVATVLTCRPSAAKAVTAADAPVRPRVPPIPEWPTPSAATSVMSGPPTAARSAATIGTPEAAPPSSPATAKKTIAASSDRLQKRPAPGDAAGLHTGGDL